MKMVRQDITFRMKKITTALLTSLYLLSPLKSQDTLKFNSDRWILPDFEVNYVRDKNQSTLEGKLDNLISFEYSENKYSSEKINIYERFNELYSNYVFERGNPSVNVSFENDKGEKGFIKGDSSVIPINSLINKFLDGDAKEGEYKIMAGEGVYDIKVNKIEDTDSSVVYQVPLGYEPLNIEQAKIEFRKNGSNLEPKEIFIDFPWYFSFLDYKLEKID